MSDSCEFPPGDINTGFFPDFHSNAKPSSTHWPFIINASAIVEDLSGAFNFFEAVTSPLALLSRMGVPISSTHFLSVFLTDPSPTHDPLSTTHHRAPVATSPNKEESEECVTIGLLELVSGAPCGARCCAT